ncbi:MAG: M28 family metallopeptidase [Bacteroidales bacterium]
MSVQKSIFRGGLLLTLLGGAILLFFFLQKRDSQPKPPVAQPSYLLSDEITSADIMQHIEVLTADSLEGRRAGKRGEVKAARYIRDQFANMSLKLYGDSGLQPFTFKGRIASTHSTCRFDGVTGIERRDYYPFVLNNASPITSPVLFVGFDPKKSPKNPFEGIEIRDRLVMVFEERYPFQHYQSAIAGGATGLLTVIPDSVARDFLPAPGQTIMYPKANAPGFRISGKMANLLLQRAGTRLKEVIERVYTAHEKVILPIPVEITCELRTGEESLHSENVMAGIVGSDSLQNDKYIVIGAHYDHLGTRTFLTATADSTVTYDGADDNASGVAVLLEIAQKIAASNPKPARSLLFVAFGAEESGLKGSYHLVDNLPIPAESIQYMINLDMVGRMDSAHTLHITLLKVPEYLRNRMESLQNLHPDINVVLNARQHGRSDYLPFSQKGIPALALTTGTHPQYHTPADTAGLISAGGSKAIAEFVADLLTSSR